MLRNRLFYGILMVVFSVGVLVVDTLYLTPYYPLFAITIALVGWLGAGELAGLLRHLPLPVSERFCQIGTVAILLSNWVPHFEKPIGPRDSNIIFPCTVFVAFGMFAFLKAARRFREPGQSVAGIAANIFSLFYLGVLGSFVIQIRWLGQPEVGAAAFFLCMFTAKFCDIGAYFAGRLFGRTKVTPVLSPGKTLEGFAGGLLMAVALAMGCVLVGKWLRGWEMMSMPAAVVFGLVIGVTSQIGDLMESLIKRDCQQKDASNLIPGFGGVLDVIDSVLFCGPVAYIFLVFIRPLGPG